MELEQGKIITGSFTIDKMSVSEHLAELELNNGTTKIIGLLSNNIDLFSKTYSVGEKIICKGKIRKRRKNYCLDIIYVSKNILDPEINKKFNSENYINRFNEVVADIVDIDYKKILDNCFTDDLKELFFTYPGSATSDKHHGYVHGLLQHSIEVVDICIFLSSYFENVNKDLLICAGLLHDIGKLKTYDIEDTKTKKTDWYHLLGHLSISALIVSKIVPEDVDQEKAMQLYHLILSHHGKLEWGSPVKCMTKEAYILHKADELSSVINRVDSLKYNGHWSELDISKQIWFRSTTDA